MSAIPKASIGERNIVLRTRGIRHGPITRLVSPSDIFEESNNAIAVQADTLSRFVLGSSVKHPHELVLGRYSVHTTRTALVAGESEIQRIGHQLVAAGLLQ
jgi:hypothetical protein